MCTLSATINSIGLGLDIVGATLLLFFWVAPQTAFAGQVATNEFEYNERDRKKLKRMKWVAWLGFGLMILGFVLQLVSNYVT